MGRKQCVFRNSTMRCCRTWATERYLSGALVKEGSIQVVQATVLHVAMMKVVLGHCDLQRKQNL